MFLKPRVNVIGFKYPYGVQNDRSVVVDVLNQAGFRARYLNEDFHCGEGQWNKGKTQLRRIIHKKFSRALPKSDINLFLERIRPELFTLARHQVLLPNQEWFLESNKVHLPKFDLVLCKTRHAQEIFFGLGCRTVFTSFTSEDERQPLASPKRREFLMVLGNREHIGDRVLKVWARHPEWPTLTLSGRRIAGMAPAPNVRLIRDYRLRKEIVRWQNEHLFHLGVTASEGFGHKLAQAMACGAIVLATNGPPMNEVIQPDRGLLVNWDRTNPKNLGFEFHFDEADFERAVEKCLRLTPEETDRLSHSARAWFERNDRFFRKELPGALGALCGWKQQFLTGAKIDFEALLPKSRGTV